MLRVIGKCVLVIGLVTGVGRSQEGETPEECVCEVFNAHNVSSHIDCECTPPGGGADVDPITVSVAVFPGLEPESGKCPTDTCGQDTKDCVYGDIQVTITVAHCARDCTGHKATTAGIPYTRSRNSTTVWQGPANPAGATLAFGSANPVTVGAPSLGTSKQCGQGPWKETLSFKKKNGNPLLDITFTWSCGKCTDAAE